ncbi:MAG TPA: TlpA disulfide reductase family protein [Phycisphaerae bacterium]|nr:TlpA disulfide reductase family protein [Phycisphaerae bacterium]
MTRFTFSCPVALILLFPVLAWAEATPEAKEILTKANAAAQKLDAISFEAQYTVDGDFVGKFPQVSGRVLAVRGEPGKAHRLFVQGATQMPGQSQTAGFRFATDGDDAFKIEEQTRTCLSGKLANAQVSEVNVLFPAKYFGDIFQNELTRGATTLEGVQTIEGVECDVVKFIPDSSGNNSVSYFLGKKDGLVRRIENAMKIMMPGAPGPVSGRVIFNARNIDTAPKTDANAFRLPCPEGYRAQVFQGAFNQVAENAKGFLPSGSLAPDWELKTPDGKTVSLKSLRGKVVVMDFWSSWCGPCKMAMPGLQKVHEAFKDKPVAILGINCRERSPAGEKAAMEFVRQKALTYTQLLKGDSVAAAYKVSGIPCFYVIGPDGKVLYATAGFQPQLHDYMKGIIEKSLPTQAAAGANKEGAGASQ